MTNKIHNTIIIWSWPAGHTAAIYAARANLEPLMFEGFLAWWVAAGGQLTTTTTVENFPWRPDGIMWPELMDRMRSQSIHAGTTILTQTVDSVDFSDPKVKKIYSEWIEYLAKTVIIATWATAKKLPIEWLDQYWMNGISWCAVCDWAAPIFRNRALAVIWWWDVAVEEAVYLTKFASKVYLIVRRDELRASKAMQKHLEHNDKIEILRNTECIKANGDDLLQNIYIRDNLTWESSELAVNGLFFAIWHTPNTNFLNNQIQLDDAWYILTKPGSTRVVDPSQYSWKVSCWVATLSGIFAAWDVADKVYRQAITSAWTWCMAALEAEKRIKDNE